jgi:hypothetical protein
VLTLDPQKQINLIARIDRSAVKNRICAKRHILDRYHGIAMPPMQQIAL